MWQAVEVGTQTDLADSSATGLPFVEEISHSPPVTGGAQSQVLELNVGGALLSVAHATLTQVWTDGLKVGMIPVCVLSQLLYS